MRHALEQREKEAKLLKQQADVAQMVAASQREAATSAPPTTPYSQAVIDAGLTCEHQRQSHQRMDLLSSSKASIEVSTTFKELSHQRSDQEEEPVCACHHEVHPASL